MYSENTRLNNHQSHPLFARFFSTGNAALEGQSISSDAHSGRPIVVTAGKDEDGSTNASLHQVPLDIPTQRLRVPESNPFDTINVSRSSSFSQGDNISISPAAMFLSAFSSPPPPAVFPDAEGQIVSGYTLGPIIGYGGFSTIRSATCSSGGVAAVKIIRRSELSKQSNPSLARKRLDHEAAVWSSLSHEHILPLFSAVHTSYADFFFTLLCPAGSLFDILKRDGRPALPQDDAGMMFRQVVRGLRYLHQVAMSVHRDIKLENILVDEMGVCKIGDFGMTRKIGELDDDDDDDEEVRDVQQEQPQSGGAFHRTTPQSKRQAKPGLSVHLSMIRHNGGRHRNSTPASSSPVPAPTHPAHVFQPGSLPYASPELLLPTSSALLPDPAQDIWALGVLLYALLTGRLPFVDGFEPRLQMKILHGAYEVPAGIGRGAEAVLQGCLDRSVPNRWTIDKIDEVAWGVGWGTEGDLTPDDDEDIHTPTKIPPSRSRSRVRPADLIIPLQDHDWQQVDESRSRPSLEAAQRRSSSRAQRSLSRAPLLKDRPTSSRGSASRSISRPPVPTPPSFSALNTAILRTNSSSSTSSSTPSSPFPDSALLTSPSRERGRRLKKSHMGSASRSCSPSVAPTTPVDFGDRFPVPLELMDERESSRGRRKFGRGVRTPRSEHLYSSVGETELDVLDETARWAADTKRETSAGGSRFPGHLELPGYVEVEERSVGWRTERSRLERGPRTVSSAGPHRSRRAGSTPPAPASPWSMENGTGSLRFADTPPHQPRDRFLSTSKTMPMPIPGKGTTRSRSVGGHLPRKRGLGIYAPPLGHV